MSESKVKRPTIKGCKLCPPHVDELADSGISPGLALRNGVKSVTGPQAVKQWLKDFGIPTRGKRIDSLLVFPYRSINGDSWQPRLKVFPPINYTNGDGKSETIKYIQAKGAPNHLYLPVGLNPEANTPLFLTEGEKKALCLTHNGFPCIGLGGVWNWKSNGQAIPDFDLINWKGRQIYLVFDADKAINSQVLKAEKALAGELAKRGAKVLIIDLPYGEDEPKGVDDFLVQHGVKAFKKLPQREFTTEEEYFSLKDALSGPERLAVNFSDFLNLELPNREYLVEGDLLLEKASVNFISAPAGTGKTMLLYEVAKMVASGGYGLCNSSRAKDKNKVLYIDGEMSFADIKDRATAFDLDDLPHLTLLSKLLLELRDVKPNLNLSEAEIRDTLTEYILEEQFALVILDNLFSLFPNLDLNSATDYSPINQWLLKLRSHNIAVIMAHHTGKNNDQLGSVAKLFNATLSLILLKETPEDGDEECCSFRIEVQKQRGQGLSLTGKRFIFRNNQWELEGGCGEAELYQVAVRLDKGLTFKTIAKELGLSVDQVKRRKGKLWKLEYIDKTGNKFPLNSKGKEWVTSFQSDS